MKAIPATRRKARHYTMQALYQWQMTHAEPQIIEAEFRVDNDMTHVDTDYFHELLSNIPKHATALEQAYSPYLQGRGPAELDAITKALLWMATYEFIHRIDVPYKVVINEAVSLGKKFGATDSFKFINGVLDQLALELRIVETKRQ
ncbi:MAG: N utilization substance protein B [Cellvibrionaceae bacterium]|jgi:N utilization substance protein B